MKSFGEADKGLERCGEACDPPTPKNVNDVASKKGGFHIRRGFKLPAGPFPSRNIPPSPRQESPLRDLLSNIIVPVIALNLVSGYGTKPWHLGPVWGLGIAIAMPLSYSVWFFMRTRRANALSIAGMGSILLTGWITWAAWQPDGSVDARFLTVFAVKESLLPTLIGLCVLMSQRTSNPLIHLFIFNAQVFDIQRIDYALNSEGTRKEFDRVLRNAAFALAGTFLMSGAIIFFLTLHLLGAVDATAPNARELYNKAISRQMLWGFVAVGVPFVFAAGFILVWLLKRLEKLTRLKSRVLMALR